jgi:probable HAF family extracellular repeat protein
MNVFTVEGSMGRNRRREDGPARRWAVARKLVLGLSLAFACETAMAQSMYRMKDMGPLEGTSNGIALNASGQATGTWVPSTCAPTPCGVTTHAFIWKNNGSSLQNIGSPQTDEYSTAVAINGSGQVAGNTLSVAFFWANNGTPMQDLGTLGGYYSHAEDVNDLGQVTGTAYLAGNTATHAFHWANNGTPMRDLGTLRKPDGNSDGVAINNAGQVTGHSDVNGSTTYPYHAFLWRNDGTPMQDLGDLGGDESYGVAINSSGQVTGYSATRPQSGYHAFLWKNDGTPMQDLGDLSGHGSYSVAINDAGQVTGNSCTQNCSFNHAFFWKNDGTPMVFLGTLGGHDSTSEAMNKSGQVTGSSSTIAGNNIKHAFLWRNDGTKMQDLNALIDRADPLKPYVTLINGDAINDASQILADGIDSRTGQTHAYFLQGTLLTLLPRSLAFGNQPINTKSAANSVTMTNTNSKVVAITSIALKGTAAGQFAQTNNCGKSLAGHATCTVKVTFKPTTKGAKSATLNVNGGGGGLRTVTLTGTGT